LNQRLSYIIIYVHKITLFSIYRVAIGFAEFQDTCEIHSDHASSKRSFPKGSELRNEKTLSVFHEIWKQSRVNGTTARIHNSLIHLPNRYKVVMITKISNGGALNQIIKTIRAKTLFIRYRLYMGKYYDNVYWLVAKFWACEVSLRPKNFPIQNVHSFLFSFRN
jgi:hypothetical protein